MPGLDGASKLQWRLAAELHNDPDKFAVALLRCQDLNDVLLRERFEIQPVRGVVVGGDGFRIAVDHDGFVARLRERHAGVAAAIVEFYPLADPVRPAAEHNDFLELRGIRFALGLAGERSFVGRVHVGRLGVEFGGAGIDSLEYRPNAQAESIGSDFAFFDSCQSG